MTNRVKAWLIFFVFVAILAFGLSSRPAGREIDLWWRVVGWTFMGLVSLTFLWRWTRTTDPRERQRIIDHRGFDVLPRWLVHWLTDK